jgi:hypothetical protein
MTFGKIKIENCTADVDREPNIVFRDHHVDTRDLRGHLADIAITDVIRALNAEFGYGGAYAPVGAWSKF